MTTMRQRNELKRAVRPEPPASRGDCAVLCGSAVIAAVLVALKLAGVIA